MRDREARISSRVWGDEKFRALSDDGKLIWFFLLTHPHLNAVGGMRATTEGLAAELRWNVDRFVVAFVELARKRMIYFDPESCCLLLPNWLKYNRPASLVQAQGWKDAFNSLPECQLRALLWQGIRRAVADMPAKIRDWFISLDWQHEGELVIESPGEIRPEQLAAERASIAIVLARYRHFHPRYRSGDSDSVKIRCRLREGWSAEDLCRAIDGCHRSPFHCGENADEKKYQSLELIVRDAAHVQKFIEIAQQPVSRLTPKERAGLSATSRWVDRMRTPRNPAGSVQEVQGEQPT